MEYGGRSGMEDETINTKRTTRAIKKRVIEKIFTQTQASRAGSVTRRDRDFA